MQNILRLTFHSFLRLHSWKIYFDLLFLNLTCKHWFHLFGCCRYSFLKIDNASFVKLNFVGWAKEFATQEPSGDHFLSFSMLQNKSRGLAPGLFPSFECPSKGFHKHEGASRYSTLQSSLFFGMNNMSFPGDSPTTEGHNFSPNEVRRHIAFVISRIRSTMAKTDSVRRKVARARNGTLSNYCLRDLDSELAGLVQSAGALSSSLQGLLYCIWDHDGKGMAKPMFLSVHSFQYVPYWYHCNIICSIHSSL